MGSWWIISGFLLSRLYFKKGLQEYKVSVCMLCINAVILKFLIKKKRKKKEGINAVIVCEMYLISKVVYFCLVCHILQFT